MPAERQVLGLLSLLSTKEGCLKAVMAAGKLEGALGLALSAMPEYPSASCTIWKSLLLYPALPNTDPELCRFSKVTPYKALFQIMETQSLGLKPLKGHPKL